MLFDKHGNPINKKGSEKRFHNLVKWGKRKFLTITAFLALLAAIALNLSQIRTFFTSFFSKLEIVDVTFENSTLEKSETGIIKELPEEISIKLRNPTNQVIFLKKAVFEVADTWKLYPSGAIASIVEPSAQYDISMPNKKTPFELEKTVSEKLGPKDVDRFNFIIKKGSGGTYIVLLRIRFYYNSGFNNYLESSNIVISMLDPDDEGFFRTSVINCNCNNLDSIENIFRSKANTVWQVGLVQNCRVKNDVSNLKNVIYSDITRQLLK